MSEDMDSEVGGGEATGGDAPTLTQTPWTGDLRLLLLIAGPNVVSTAAQTIMSFVDYAIVSKLPNASAAQAATSCGGVIWFSVFSFLLGVMVCVTTTVSQSFGAKRPRDCSAYAWQGLWICMLFGAGSLALWPVLPWFFNIIGHTPDVQAMEAEYTQIRLLSMGAAGATVALAQFFIGIHRPGVNAASAVAATVLNAVLTYCLVFGKCGLPAMGVAGAAWGTVIATCFRTLWLLAAMCFGRKAAEFHARRTWRIDADKMRRLIRVGWPSGLQFFLEIAAWEGIRTELCRGSLLGQSPVRRKRGERDGCRMGDGRREHLDRRLPMCPLQESQGTHRPLSLPIGGRIVSRSQGGVAGLNPLSGRVQPRDRLRPARPRG